MAAANKGFTLIELLVTVALFGILAAIAVPFMGDLIAERRVATSAQEFMAAHRLARSEAIKRGANIVICGKYRPASQRECAFSHDWATGGWLIATGVAPRESNVEIIALQPPFHSGLKIDSSVTLMTYMPDGSADFNGASMKDGYATFVFSMSNKFHRQICVSSGGHIQFANQIGSSDLAC